MIRPEIFICFLFALLAGSSAIPYLRESNVQDLVVVDFNSKVLAETSNDFSIEDNLEHAKNQEIQVSGWWGSKGVHNLTVGYKTYQDRLLYSANIRKSYRLGRVLEENIVVRSPHGERISCIEAYDLHSRPSEAGYASVVSGGTGTRNVTIHLQSARNHGLKFYVRVFGHY